jgi:nucleotide-binding universal stress UspA family protein
MFRPLKTILFATNLSENSQHAYNYAAVMALQFQATIILLHVIEKSSDYIEGRLRVFLGEAQWQKLQQSRQRDVRTVLIGKKSVSKKIREALTMSCDQLGIDNDSCDFLSKEIVISDGDVINDIIETAKKYSCDLIVMGAHDGFLSNNTIGATIKAVMRHSRRPVLVVPPIEDN